MDYTEYEKAKGEQPPAPRDGVAIKYAEDKPKPVRKPRAAAAKEAPKPEEAKVKKTISCTIDLTVDPECPMLNPSDGDEAGRLALLFGELISKAVAEKIEADLSPETLEITEHVNTVRCSVDVLIPTDDGLRKDKFHAAPISVVAPHQYTNVYMDRQEVSLEGSRRAKVLRPKEADKAKKL